MLQGSHNLQVIVKVAIIVLKKAQDKIKLLVCLGLTLITQELSVYPNAGFVHSVNTV
jgi:hypothetical protein